MRTRTRKRERLEITIEDIEERQNPDGTKRVIFRTSHGRLDGMYHPVEEAKVGTMLLSGAGGGFNGPASVYPDLARELVPHKIASFRMDYRFPNRLDECIIDAMIGVEYLHEEGMADIGVVGWSFGGAVAISAAAIDESVKAVATVASQSYGTEGAAHLDGKPILLLHGKEDKTIPISCSERVYRTADDPKELVIYEGANHGLDQVRDQMLEKLSTFLVDALGGVGDV